MTYALFVFVLIVTVAWWVYLWRTYRFDVWCWLSWKAGQRAGRLVEKERGRRQAALAGDGLLDEIATRWLSKARVR